MSIDPTTTAVLLIEYQNEFTSEGGALHEAVKETMEMTGMLDNTTRVADAARATGAEVMHAALAFAEGYGELGASPYGILRAVVDGSAFGKDTWGAAFDDRFQPRPGDVVVEGKRGIDAFATTNLDFILRAKGITTLALAGFMTNVCIESTMRTGYELGYHIITLTDCTATMSVDQYQNAVTYDFPMFSVPMTSTDFITELAPAAELVGQTS